MDRPFFSFIMHILEYSNYQILPTQEALLIKPIRKLYNSDKTKNKDTFLQIMSVVYFYVDPRSSYNYITNDEDRLQAIIKQEGLPKNFTITKQIEEIIEEYKKHCITTSFLLLQDTKLAIDKVRQFLRDVDLNKVDDKGKPIYTIQSVTTAIKQIPQLAKDVLEAEKAISKEIEEQGRARGGNENLHVMENGIDL